VIKQTTVTERGISMLNHCLKWDMLALRTQDRGLTCTNLSLFCVTQESNETALVQCSTVDNIVAVKPEKKLLVFSVLETAVDLRT